MPNPPFKATKRQREQVMRLIGGGMGERKVAHAMGFARSTLQTHFAVELEVAHATCEARLNDMLWTAADKGSVAAMKYLDAKGQGLAMTTARTLGKKEQQLEAAKNAGGDEWGDLLKIEPQVKAN